jgi:hypothetical protein
MRPRATLWTREQAAPRRFHSRNSATNRAFSLSSSERLLARMPRACACSIVAARPRTRSRSAAAAASLRARASASCLSAAAAAALPAAAAAAIAASAASAACAAAASRAATAAAFRPGVCRRRCPATSVAKPSSAPPPGCCESGASDGVAGVPPVTRSRCCRPLLGGARPHGTDCGRGSVAAAVAAAVAVVAAAEAKPATRGSGEARGRALLVGRDDGCPLACGRTGAGEAAATTLARRSAAARFVRGVATGARAHSDAFRGGGRAAEAAEAAAAAAGEGTVLVLQLQRRGRRYPGLLDRATAARAAALLLTLLLLLGRGDGGRFIPLGCPSARRIVLWMSSRSRCKTGSAARCSESASVSEALG